MDNYIMNSRQIGKIGEDYAIKVYVRNNFSILIRNFFNRIGKQFGEIDFIAKRGKNLHFVEIKTRSSEAFMTGPESITFSKRKRLVKTAQFFLTNVFNPEQFTVHFDLVVVRLNLFDKRIETFTIYSDVIDDT